MTNTELTDLLNHIDTQSPTNIIYKVVEHPNNTTVYDFINQNNQSKLTFSYQVFDYYINPEDICLTFYNTSDPNTPIGIVIAKKSTLLIKHTDRDFVYLNNDHSNTFDRRECFRLTFVNVYKRLRTTSFLQHMINHITKYIVTIHPHIDHVYHTSNRRHGSSFAKRTYYFRPIQIDTLLETNVIQTSITHTKTLLKRLYNSFSYPKDFVTQVDLQYINSQMNVEDTFCDVFVDNLLQLTHAYHNSHSYIYEQVTTDTIRKLLLNPKFHHFIIRNKQNTITDWVCLYETTKTPNLPNVSVCNPVRNASTYTFIYTNQMSYVLELISEFCYHNNLFDQITIPNLLDLKSYEYTALKLLKTNTMDYFYLINMEMTFVDSHKNGLV